MSLRKFTSLRHSKNSTSTANIWNTEGTPLITLLSPNILLLFPLCPHPHQIKQKNLSRNTSYSFWILTVSRNMVSSHESLSKWGLVIKPHFLNQLSLSKHFMSLTEPQKCLGPTFQNCISLSKEFLREDTAKLQYALEPGVHKRDFRRQSFYFK